ncbi:MAG: VanZ family protein [Casimicrobiaceae bacterium]
MPNSTVKPIARTPRSHLPHILAALYTLAIVFASLQPFGPWLAPPAAEPLWLLSSKIRTTRFDSLLNIIAYVPLGVFVALMPRRAHPVRRLATGALAGFVLSFAMESLQAYLPTRDASLIDWMANTLGATGGGALAAWFARSAQLKRALSNARNRWFLVGKLGDLGLALLALWLVAQSNPGIGLFAISWDPSIQAMGSAVPRESAAFLIDAFESALQFAGIGLFVALLVRERRFFGAAMLALIVAASIAKGGVSAAMLRPPAWESWLRPEISFGIAAGAVLLLAASGFSRPVMVVSCTVALLLSVALPPLVTDQQSVHITLTLFNWRYGQLLNFNGLTHTVLLAWPLAATLWLFALAGRPEWGADHASDAIRIG